MGVLNEFKTFAMRGNVVDLAVGIIIGAAFGAIVNSLVNDVIMPIIGYVTGGMDFKDLSYVLKPAATAADGAAIPAVTPGTTCTGTPWRARWAASSPPRPNRKGSPPFSRTTQLWRPASSTSTALVEGWGTEWWPRRLPTKCFSAPSGTKARTSWGTSES